MQEKGVDALYQIAESQGGYFTTAQALEAGVSRRLLSHYAARADLERVAYGIYRLHRFPAHRFGDLIATALWAGPGSAVSHDSALAVYELGSAMPAVIHLTVPRAFRGKRPGVVIHRASLSPEEVTLRDDVPITKVERTLRDVAVAGDPSLARDAAREAIERGLTTRARLSETLDEHPDRDHVRSTLGLPKAKRAVPSRGGTL
ncbi:MAG: type IV toxin-antitoxin system AbiEi family antitoxin domain-containing protein [Dehalococcoidia bacterium]|nr:type IV toxin-antitoxin system AbiEi family antitoxin domain-containing protein [Dehalococcoidia bacterium]